MKLLWGRSTQRTIKVRGAFTGTKGHTTGRRLRGPVNCVPEKLEKETQRRFPRLQDHHSSEQKVKIKQDERAGGGWNDCT